MLTNEFVNITRLIISYLQGLVPRRPNPLQAGDVDFCRVFGYNGLTVVSCRECGSVLISIDRREITSSIKLVVRKIKPSNKTVLKYYCDGCGKAIRSRDVEIMTQGGLI